MASRTASLFDAAVVADRWIADYRAARLRGDVMADAADDGAWRALFEELASNVGESLEDALDRAQRQADDIGTGFRVAGDSDERPWPLSPVPLLIDSDEWAGIRAGVVQRAELLEMIVADLYGPARLVAQGLIPAAVVTGSPYFLRPMQGLVPPGGHHLNVVAVDLCRGPTGEWRVMADHLRGPVGAGYALENRLAIARTMGGLQARLNVERHAPFFASLRDGLAAACARAEPRIGLLTPGRLNQSYAEQAHLARYLGFLLVEGADLAVIEDRLYVRTIAGLKRVDALWRRTDPTLLDPLAFDSTSAIGVPGLIDAMAAGNVVVANAPGAAVLESPALAAFLPGLCTRLTGEGLSLPNIATWWCGQPRDAALVVDELASMTIAPAFGVATRALPDGRPVVGADLSDADRAALLADIERRPQDYVGQEVVHLSTMPVVIDRELTPRPFTLRVFAARDPRGGWSVLPGGFARIGEGADPRMTAIGEGEWSADVIVHGADAVDPVSLLPAVDSLHLRRNPGTLPSRAADNLFWLGRYLERGEALLGLIRVLLGHSITADAGASLAPATVQRIAAMLASLGAAPAPVSHRRPDLVAMARTALESVETGWYSVRGVNRQARGLGRVSRDRLSADMIRLLDAPHPTRGGVLDRAGSLQRRYAALAGLSAEHMGRTDGWRFHDLGRRIERAAKTVQAIRAFGIEASSADDLSVLLDLADSQISYRQRYLTGVARIAVIDLVALDPGNPRGLAFQAARIAEHLAALPVLKDDGLAEPQQRVAAELSAMLATADAAIMDGDALCAIEGRLFALADAVARRYFLQGAEPLRAGGLVLA
ncbi:circularly permuted type 2 ATP-grasp protein [Sphingomonas sp.]|uniref:circularly permuted type 2 ATP-grasp protein n=1 Tax=Sphingomonas sp. TaxID=28214 RepID=UPI002B8838BA|nr:circularly permuted type 2 ATP-grasp protein [Sphingomonas sp.]HTG39156.1 circularly permuted type 2 ATP-grasp protein [Sphingomonas sp.]